ncbi:ABC transporter ATP-binding protein [Paenibacillus zanthoxyli]|uniref:ABC transporter ATP-binding protein n=1 Tax=Paenibacillus zanthoxyli TaxID=369399 RepID=UPI000470E6B7|nr:ABC transporter ATP-binding protein [Paenibacillus zanthoxyli]
MQTVCELINVSKKYGKHIVIDKLNLTIHQGEMVAITGKSGSGKTTVLNMIGLLEKPDQGNIRLFDKPAPRPGSGQTNKLLRTKMSYLFQNYALIDQDTIDANLEVALLYSGKSKEQKQKAKIEALQRVKMNASLKQKIHELSGGEQQRVAIARILLKSSELILADEPTGSLDTDNRDAIIQILKELNQSGQTIIIVTHDEEVASQCSRVINL